MEVKFVTKPQFAVMGIEGSGPADQGVSWIKPLWAEASQRFGEIQEQVTGAAWGLMSAPDRFLERWTERGGYLAGWEVSLGAKAFGQWKIWRVPESAYATVECTVKTYGEAMRYVEKPCFIKRETNR
jgi:predicted transcriptional regulator YdeE